ncbi:MAG: DUF4097 domain-containing protein [Clostridia bacterium]|nr:DUF4097 domain-containing protein [Clostridia bacterium]
MSDTEKKQPRRGLSLGWKIALWVIAGLVTAALLAAAVVSVLQFFDIVPAISIPRHIIGYDDSVYTACGGTVSEKVTGLDIDWIAGDVRIVPTSDDELSITETWANGGEVKETDALRRAVIENRLYIKYTKPTQNLRMTQDKQLTVKVPAAWIEDFTQGIYVDTESGSVTVQINAKYLKINTASADITVNGAYEKATFDTASGMIRMTGSAATLWADTASGDIVLDGKFGVTELNTASGQTRFTGSTDSMEIDNTSGRVTLTLTAPADELDIETVSGPVTVFLPDALRGFVLDADTASADVNIHDFSVTYKKGKYTFGDGSMKFEFDSTSGDLDIFRTTVDAEGN